MVDRKQVKTVGEYWVAAELARRGWAPALTRDGLERTDILASGTTSGATIQVQVKAMTMTMGPRGSGKWRLGRKTQQPAIAPNEWFVLVAIPQELGEPLRSFIVPRDHVGAAAWITHQNWLTDPTVPAGQRNASADQAMVDLEIFARYENRWDLLEDQAAAAPVLLPVEYWKLAQAERVGLPKNHPWTQELPGPWG